MNHSRHYSAISAKGKEYLLHPNTMALKNCPLISNVEMKTLSQNFTSSFNELPKELHDCSAWERVSKYCSFSKFPIPDGCPFYYSKSLKKVSGA